MELIFSNFAHFVNSVPSGSINTTWTETFYTGSDRASGMTTVINLAPVLTNTIGDIQSGMRGEPLAPSSGGDEEFENRLKRDLFDFEEMEPRLAKLRKELRMMNRVKSAMEKRAKSLQDCV